MKCSVSGLINVEKKKEEKKTRTEELYPCKQDLAPLVQDAWWASGPLRMGTKHIAPTRVQIPDHLAHSGCERYSVQCSMKNELARI